MDSKAYSTGEQSPVTSDKEPGFFKKHKYGLLMTGAFLALVGTVYVMLLGIAGNVITRHSDIYEYHNPRAAEQKKKNREEKIKKEIENDPFLTLLEKGGHYIMPIVEPISKATITPWKNAGYVMPEDYKEVRDKAFQIAGIDEKNPLHDERRFKLYRELGFAVRSDYDGSIGIYIPFKAWKEFIEKNSSFKNPEWDQLIEPEVTDGGKYTGTVKGKAFYKADSEDQGGNEDGVVDDSEWNRALKAMGYTTVDDIINEIIEKVNFNSPELKSELRQIVESVKKNYKIVDFDTKIPIIRLESYVQMN